jgi:cyclophilin family peptidyl-prolyl cis-trans isomerase
MMMKLAFLCCLGLALAMSTTGTAQAANPIVEVETTLGNFKIELYPEKAPVTVKNFLSYVEDKFYDGTIFHRVIGKENADNDFMIQGGGFEPGMKQKPTKPPIKNESGNGLSNLRGTIAMARTNEPDSATSQFFINVGDNTFLDSRGGRVGYAVFGRVIEGMAVVDKIKAVETGNRGMFQNVPKTDVIIKSIKVVSGK